MPIITAFEKNGCVYVATDTQKEIDSVLVNLRDPENVRIKAFENGVIVGCLGKARLTQLIFANKQWFDTDKLDKRYIVTQIVPKIYEEIKDLENWKSEEYDDEKSCSLSVVIAKGKDVFFITNELNVIKSSGCLSTSYGRGECMMSAYIRLSNEDDPETLIKKAFKECSGYNSDAFSSVAVINTKEMKLKFLEGNDDSF